MKIQQVFKTKFKGKWKNDLSVGDLVLLCSDKNKNPDLGVITSLSVTTKDLYYVNWGEKEVPLLKSYPRGEKPKNKAWHHRDVLQSYSDFLEEKNLKEIQNAHAKKIKNGLIGWLRK